MDNPHDATISSERDANDTPLEVRVVLSVTVLLTIAVRVTAPMVAGNLTRVDAVPEEVVVADAASAAPVSIENATVAPEIGLPYLSTTVATIGETRVAPNGPSIHPATAGCDA